MSADRKPDYQRSLRRQHVAGLAIIAFFGLTLGVWSMTTSLRGAVAAGGQFVVTGDVKKVQHPTGGVVGQLLVRDGDKVEAGDVLLRLDETIPRANYQIVTKQLDEFAVRAVRLEAERDGSDRLVVPEALASRRDEPAIAKLLAAETRLFEVRHSAREGQRQQLKKRVAQLRDEIAGLKAQQAAKAKESEIIATELVGVQDLYRQNLVQLTRLSALQRDQASIAGQRGQLTAAVAQAEGKIAETELQIIQIDEELRAEVMKELREIQGREAELIERKTAAEDQLRRVDLKAPTSGTVHQLAVHTVGGVISPGEVTMLIVPAGVALELEARVPPNEIDQVARGQTARVRVQAGHQSQNPELAGTVTRVSADVTKDERQGLVFYTVRVAVPPEELKRLNPISVIAGMQAEAFIETVERSPIDFLLKPLRDQISRTFRER
ncbi:HlyD family type I secretion periplasmic adaptor subunit [Enterovirga rhinocerotis]|uniref:Membrane fusion protein (MFP) family protein n=1 Tax=Enterovirga rhinocerotis TaxID=1339210 RepID=A0A4R7CBR6_9HYPH|nr:HlyD family type I secretion periplasmic adaptor subunit [Enterovirga rhinocerotis]TDR95894.1 HlyD family secretion protein [Enterovirga rhinocerotis]